MPAKYLLIESRDPFETSEVERDYELATNLAKSDYEVTLFLVQNGVLAARRGSKPSGLQHAIDSGVNVLSDEFSLRERGISKTALTDGISASPLDVVIDQMAEGRKTLWL